MEKKQTNPFILSAAFLMALTFLVHVFIGGPDLYRPLRASGLSDIEISSFSVVWHFVSVNLLFSAVALFHLAITKNTALFVFTLANAFCFALLFMLYGLFDLHSLWIMPQWTVFALVSALMLLGKR